MKIHVEAFQAIHASIAEGGKQVLVLWSPANVRRLRTHCDKYKFSTYWANDINLPGKIRWLVKVIKAKK